MIRDRVVRLFAIATCAATMIVVAGCPGSPLQGDSGPDPLTYACAASLPCNPITSTGCDGGLACLAVGNYLAAPMISCATGAVTLGGLCGAAAAGPQCGAGLLCQDGVCRRLCCAGDPHSCTQADLAPGSTCVVAVSETGLGACNKTCTWTTQTGCTGSETCGPVSNTGVPSICVPAGSAFVYAACDPRIGNGRDCGPGLYCVGTNTANTAFRCLRICDYDASPDGGVGICPSGSGCLGLGSMQFPRNFGVCVRACLRDGSGPACPSGTTCQRVNSSDPNVGGCFDP